MRSPRAHEVLGGLRKNRAGVYSVSFASISNVSATLRHSQTLKEFQHPGPVPLVQAPKLLCFRRSGVLVSLDGVFQTPRAAVMEKELAVSQTRA